MVVAVGPGGRPPIQREPHDAGRGLDGVAVEGDHPPEEIGAPHGGRDVPPLQDDDRVLVEEHLIGGVGAQERDAATQLALRDRVRVGVVEDAIVGGRARAFRQQVDARPEGHVRQDRAGGHDADARIRGYQR